MNMNMESGATDLALSPAYEVFKTEKISMCHLVFAIYGVYSKSRGLQGNRTFLMQVVLTTPEK